jgi:hypothetical protein
MTPKRLPAVGDWLAWERRTGYERRNVMERARRNNRGSRSPGALPKTVVPTDLALENGAPQSTRLHAQLNATRWAV